MLCALALVLLAGTYADQGSDSDSVAQSSAQSAAQSTAAAGTDSDAFSMPGMAGGLFNLGKGCKLLHPFKFGLGFGGMNGASVPGKGGGGGLLGHPFLKHHFHHKKKINGASVPAMPSPAASAGAASSASSTSGSSSSTGAAGSSTSTTTNTKTTGGATAGADASAKASGKASGKAGGVSTAGADIENCIVGAAAGNPDLSILAQAVGAAGDEVVALLSDPEAVLTVFAPTNEAFAELLDELDLTAEELLSNSTLLLGILSYHLVPDVKALSTDLVNDQELVTALGPTVPLTVNLDGGGVELEAVGNTAEVVQPDIEVCNSAIHVIDNVLLPVANEA